MVATGVLRFSTGGGSVDCKLGSSSGMVVVAGVLVFKTHGRSTTNGSGWRRLDLVVVVVIER